MNPSDWLPYTTERPQRRRPPRGESTCVQPLSPAYTPAPDLLASLTFTPSILRPRRRRRDRHTAVTITPFEPLTVILPGVWAPVLMSPRRRRSKARREIATIDPTFGAQLQVAAQMGWAPTPPMPRRRPRTIHDVETFTYTIPPSVPATSPTDAGCADLSADALTVTTFTAEDLGVSTFITEALTITTLTSEAVC